MICLCAKYLANFNGNQPKLLFVKYNGTVHVFRDTQQLEVRIPRHHTSGLLFKHFSLIVNVKLILISYRQVNAVY